ncbi:L-type lectin-domain containing receptor kinase VIII-1 [Nymphaea thermarum]|nr:L-type lectin-domain containing receptor kinase VIII-1 [Nymphaea thermarum]
MKLLLHFLVILSLALHAVSTTGGFIFNNGFQRANLTLDGAADVSSNGLLRLSVDPGNPTFGHAFYPLPLQLKLNQSSPPLPSSSSPLSGAAGADDTNGTVLSFSTHFAFAMRTADPSMGNHGFSFAVVPSPATVEGQSSANYLGLFNISNIGNSSNHIFAVEFDAARDAGATSNNASGNHVRIIGINSPISNLSAPASYFLSDSTPELPINLLSGSPILAWIDYQSHRQQLNVSMSPITNPIKPKKPLLSTKLDLSSVLKHFMYVGFSSGVGKVASEHYILGWSFSINGEAQSLNISQLPPLDLSQPASLSTPKHQTNLFVIFFCSLGAAAIVLLSVLASTYYIIYRRRKKNDSDQMEALKLEQPRKFPYKDLSQATHGFSKVELLGSGGFGRVYKGVLPGTSTEVAVKRFSHNGEQGMREFMAEVSSLGRLRHRNLVQLQGWCRRKGELLLVYDFMPNRSLDSFLYNDRKARGLGWEERFKILKGIASGLLYLHEGWEQVVVHRDVKSSNVLLDAEMNGRLGDFGLARFYSRGENPQTTAVVGTLGYIAPEMSRTGKATASADVYSYGALLLEVATGKRPCDLLASEQGEMVMVEWVLRHWQSGNILRAVDSRLEGHFLSEETEVVLKVGVLCSQAVAERRPTMRQVVQYLNGDASIPKELSLSIMALHDDLGLDQLVLPYPVSGAPSCDSTDFQDSAPLYEI